MSSRWNMVLIISDLELLIRARISLSFLGSSTVSGLMMPIVKGRLTCFGSSKGYYIRLLLLLL